MSDDQTVSGNLDVGGTLTVGDSGANPNYTALFHTIDDGPGHITQWIGLESRGDGADGGGLQVLCTETAGHSQIQGVNSHITVPLTPEAWRDIVGNTGRGFRKHPIESSLALAPYVVRYGLDHAYEVTHLSTIAQAFPWFGMLADPYGAPGNCSWYDGGMDGTEFLVVSRDDQNRPLVVIRKLDPTRARTDPLYRQPRLGIGCDPQVPLHIKRVFPGISLAEPLARFSGDNTVFVPNQLEVTAEDPTKKVTLGYYTPADPAGEYGAIDAAHAGVGARPLVLNPSGGVVGFGGLPPLATLDAATKFHVQGKGRFDGQQVPAANVGAVATYLRVNVDGNDYALALHFIIR